MSTQHNLSNIKRHGPEAMLPARMHLRTTWGAPWRMITETILRPDRSTPESVQPARPSAAWAASFRPDLPLRPDHRQVVRPRLLHPDRRLVHLRRLRLDHPRLVHPAQAARPVLRPARPRQNSAA